MQYALYKKHYQINIKERIKSIMSEIVPFVQLPQGRVYYSLVQKQSQMGLSFNTRLLILLSQNYIGYISKPNLKNIKESVDLNKVKTTIQLQKIQHIIAQSNLLHLQGIIEKENNKFLTIKWMFRMTSPQLATQWVNLLQVQISPTPSRNVTQDQGNHSFNIVPVQRDNEQQSPIKIQHRLKIVEQEKTFQKKKSNFIQQPLKLYQVKQSENENENSSPISKNQSPKNLISVPKVIKPVANTINQQNNHFVAQLVQLAHKFQDEKFLNFFRSRHPNTIQYNTKCKSFQQYCQLTLVKFLSNQDNGHCQLVNLIAQRYYDQYKKHKFEETDSLQYRILEVINPLVIKKPYITITMPFTELKQVPVTKASTNKVLEQSICNETFLKNIQQQMKNLDYIWACLKQYGEDIIDRFSLPITCLVEYGGFIAYFKTNYNLQQLNSEPRKVSHLTMETSVIFDKLAHITGISKDSFQNEKIIEIIPYGNNSKFIINSVKSFLPKLSVDKIITPGLRPEIFAEYNFKKDLEVAYPHHQLYQKQQALYAGEFKKMRQERLQKLINDLDKLQVYFIEPSQVGSLIHSYGLNVKDLGKICETTKNLYIKTIIKAEIAGRIAKIILRKRNQQRLVNNAANRLKQKKQQSQSIISMSILKSFIQAIITNNSQESKLFWKAFDLHSQLIYSTALNYEQINKSYYIKALEFHLGIRIKFKSATLIQSIALQKDKIETIRLISKKSFYKQHYIPFISPGAPEQKWNLFEFVKQGPASLQNAQKILATLNMKSKLFQSSESGGRLNQFPQYLTDWQLWSIIAYLMNFIGPNYSQCKDIPIYNRIQQTYSLQRCKCELTHTKWKIKNSMSSKASTEIFTQIINLEQLLKKLTHMNNNQAFPFLSQMHDLLSLYFLNCKLYVLAIHYAKASLTNMMKLTGSNVHIKIAGSYFQLGHCLMQCIGKRLDPQDNARALKSFYMKNLQLNRRNYKLLPQPQQIEKTALSQPIQQCTIAFKKAKNILQTNQTGEFTARYFASVDLQLGKLSLLVGKDSQCKKYINNALSVMLKPAKTQEKFQLDDKIRLQVKLNQQPIQAISYDVGDIIECFQLLARSSWSNHKDMILVSNQLLNWLENYGTQNNLEDFTDNLLQRIMRIIVEGYLLQIFYPKQKSKPLKSSPLASTFTIFVFELTNSFSLNYAQSLQNLRILLEDNNLKNYLQFYWAKSGQNMSKYLYMMKNTLKVSRKNDDELSQFENFTKCIIGSVGEGFVGEMLENWNLLLKS